MLLKIHPENPSEKNISKVVDCLNNKGVIIFPTDTIYAIGCNINCQKAIERVAQIKGIKLEKADFSVIFSGLSNLSIYTKQLNNSTFKMMKHALPGPFTFILEANNQIPVIFKRKKKTIGIRVPNNNIALEIVRRLGNPIISTSVHDEDEIIEYTTDPELIHERYKSLVDIVIDGGFGNNVPSTVVDCTNDQYSIIRQGIGIIK